jgi:hypothetical protein
LVAWLLAVLLPSSNTLVFSGLPLDTWPEWLALVLLAPVVVSPRIARRIPRRVAACRLPPGLVLAGAVLTVAAKLALSLLVGHHGFVACYRSPVASPATQCEPTFAYPFSGGGYTRFEEAIDRRGAAWGLAFLNSVRLAPPAGGSQPRELEPFSVEYSGEVELARSGRVRVEYAGRAELRVGDGPWVNGEAHPGVGFLESMLPAGRQHVRVRYANGVVVPDGSEASGAHEAMLRVLLVDSAGFAGPLRAAQPAGTVRVAAALVDALVALFLLVLALAAVSRAALPRLAWGWVALVGAAVLAAALVGHGRLNDVRNALVALTALLGLLLLRGPGWRVAWRSWLWGLLVGGLWALAVFGASSDTVWLRSLGNDPLTYESFARSMLSSGSLEGGEPVFYYQPFFRYVRFVERMLFGDGEPLLFAFAFGSFHAALLAFSGAALRRVRAQATSLRARIAAAAVCALLLALATTTLPMFLWPASEYPTWIVIPVAMAVFQARSQWAIGGLLLGLAAITRVNQLPGHAVLLATRIWRGGPRRPLAPTLAVAAFVIALLLPLAHNAWFGRQAVLFTTSGAIPQNLTLAPARLVTDWNNDQTRRLLASQVRAVLYLTPDGRTTPQAVAYHGLLVAWVVVALARLGRRAALTARLASLGRLASPWAFLLVHVFYQVATYYPRHIVAGYLVMGLATIEAVVSGARQGSARRSE